MSDDLADFWVHTIGVEPLIRQDSNGADVYAAPIEITCFVEETNRVVRDSNGSQVVSTVQAFCPAGTDVALDSRVTVPSGRVTQLISIERHDGGPLGLPDHVTLNLE